MLGKGSFEKILDKERGIEFANEEDGVRCKYLGLKNEEFIMPLFAIALGIPAIASALHGNASGQSH